MYFVCICNVRLMYKHRKELQKLRRFLTLPMSQTLKELSNDLMNDVPTGSADDSHYIGASVTL